ncbi:hypothetical protein BDY24DRAFT_380768 [Mrakia frigida]|uniref:uncharacterized protein n=1 Tax=Mrakia frigida TaxID=29902 RepID=UPI003FCC13E2
MALSSVSSHQIDGHSIAVLVVFLLVNVAVVFPVRIPLPRFLTSSSIFILRTLRLLNPPSQDELDSTAPKERTFFELGLNSAPVLAVLVLLASRSIDGTTLRMGIVGEETGVRPYDIMLLFISLAYLSISLDATGLLRYLAFLVSQKGGSSGHRLFLSFYAFFFVSGMLVGNDPIILSGTGFLVYFTRVTGVSPTSWLFAQFSAANIASAILVSSNPTNLIISSSFDISFPVYTAWVILPTIAAGIAAYPVLIYWEHRGDVPERMEEVDVEPGRALVDPWGAIIGSGLLAVTLIVLVAGSAAGILGGVWEVTVPAAVLMLIRDVVHDLRESSRGGNVTRIQASQDEATDGGILRRRSSVAEEIELSRVGGSESGKEELDLADAGRLETMMEEASASVVVDRNGDVSSAASLTSASTSTRPNLSNRRPSLAPQPRPSIVALSPTSFSKHRRTLPSLLTSLSERFPTPSQTFKHLPFPLLPFAFSMFILVGGLAETGWSRVFAVWWAALAVHTGTTGVTFFMISISVLLCNIVGTNIGCCLLLTSILQTWNTTHSPPPRQLTAAKYALALGSNLGAVSFTFPASLAGLLWRRILSQKGIRVGRVEFARRNWKVLLVTALVGSAVLVGEVVVMIPN